MRLPIWLKAHKAARVLRNGWTGIGPRPQGANVSLGYNRGWSFVGERRREMRAIRDDCVPRADRECIAVQLEAMCRIWAGQDIGEGLCDRRKDEARLARSDA